MGEKVTKGRAGIRWDSLVEKLWKDVGGNQEILSIDEFRGYNTSQITDGKKGKAT